MTPITLNFSPAIVISFPTESPSLKKPVWTVWPSTTTRRARSPSCFLMNVPWTTCQFRASWKFGSAPLTITPDFTSRAYRTGAGLLRTGETTTRSAVSFCRRSAS